MYTDLAALFWLAPLLARAVEERVQVGCNEYVGSSSKDGISRWLGIRYAAAPVGGLRFEPPAEPPCREDAMDAKQFGDACISTGPDEVPEGQSEDCLFLNVFAPTKAARDARLPVFFFIQGGGFNELSDPRLDAGALIASSGADGGAGGGGGMVVVTLNYRTGPYGFLTSSSSSSGGGSGGSGSTGDGDGDGGITANNGLRDQRKALGWVQRHVARFGGDPGRVVLAGASAGGASVSLQLVAYGGEDFGLFHGAAAESPSFAPVLTAAESQYQHDLLAIALGCSSGSPSSTARCIRGKGAGEIQAATAGSARPPYPGSARAPIYMWGPSVDGDMFADRTYRLFEQGRFVRVPAIFGDDTDGGTIFAPRGAASRADADAFLRDQYADLSPAQLGRLHELYPREEFDGDIVGGDDDDDDGDGDSGKREDGDTAAGERECPGSEGCFYRQVAKVYGDMRFACPALWAAEQMARRGVPAWRYRYDVRAREQTSAGLGVPHTAELQALFGPHGPGAPRSYLPGGDNARAVAAVQRYWARFVRHLDPNGPPSPPPPSPPPFTTGQDGGYSNDNNSYDDDGDDDDGYVDSYFDESEYYGGGTYARLAAAAAATTWRTVGDAPRSRLLFQTGGGTVMEELGDAARARCDYLIKIGPALKQ